MNVFASKQYYCAFGLPAYVVVEGIYGGGDCQCGRKRLGEKTV